ncbi:DEKNAAC102166 [Brettanomyces naardenensis]|uniref:Coatomer subunit delta n=1 Tax=Brettanomyces naardenensis TaxID=13370 RepID=A0A448YJZ6_BRENA|nr:DEKNAAC102166 [Brettanomyces naardenensis]
MVVLAGSICTRGGKPLLSRQFRELSKERVTSLLANFPTLLSDSTQTQHTSVEDEYVRYVYQPLEEFYVVLITNKHSNILQDIDTLHLFAQTITSILRTVDEREIFDNCFEIVSAFDEIVNLGYKENLSLSQVVTFLEMESHEEKIQEIIERNKELEAAEERKRKATEIFLSNTAAALDTRNKELMRRANLGSLEDNSVLIGQQDYQQANYSRPSAQAPYEQQPSPLGGSGIRAAPPRKGGLQLGRKSRPLGSDAEPLVNPVAASANRAPQPVPQTSSQPRIANNGILIITNEKFSAQITRDGSISSAEVKGDLQIRINNADFALAKLELAVDKPADITTQFKTHPNIDKSQFNSSSVIGMKDPSKPFPSNDQTLGVLRWKSVPKSGVTDDKNVLLPITLTTWVNNNNDGTISLTFEYENTPSKLVDDIVLVVPTVNATVESSDNNNVQLEFADDGLHVQVSDLIENPEGSFTILCREVDDEEALFPMEIVFDVTKKLDIGDKVGQVSVKGVSNASIAEDLPFDTYYKSTSEGFYIV